MARTDFLSTLNLGTLAIVLVIVAVLFAFFLRKRNNRHPMDGRQERNVAADIDSGRGAPDRSPRE